MRRKREPIPIDPMNTVKAAALAIGRNLERRQWFDMTAAEADSWCRGKAKEKGFTESDQERVAVMAMHYVLAGQGQIDL